jgi:hypothetical protein
MSLCNRGGKRYIRWALSMNLQRASHRCVFFHEFSFPEQRATASQNHWEKYPKLPQFYIRGKQVCIGV